MTNETIPVTPQTSLNHDSQSSVGVVTNTNPNWQYFTPLDQPTTTTVHSVSLFTNVRRNLEGAFEAEAKRDPSTRF